MGSQLWDSVFATQAIIASNLTDEYGSTLRKAFNFIKLSQVEFLSCRLYKPYNLVC
jgi:beta-amyrin synthase